ncbi:MAG: cytochrome c-type biogenesis protein CcmH [bacterium]
MSLLISVFTLVVATPPGMAPTQTTPRKAPTYGKAVESEAESIAGQLIAPCCWKGTLADHPSPLADQMRQEIKQLLSQGKNKKQILAFYKKKYGQAVLAEPPKGGFSGLILYGIPFGIALLLLMIMTATIARKSSKRDSDDEQDLPIDHELPDAMQQRIDALVSRDA